MDKYWKFLWSLWAGAILLMPALGRTQNQTATAIATKNPFYTLDKIWKGDEDGGPQLKDPEALSAGRDGKVYIADTGNNRIVIWDPEGGSIQSIGTFGTRADWQNPPQFNQPSGILAHPSGQIYVGDTLNQRVVVLDVKGMVVTCWGSQGTDNGQFNQPRSVTRDHFGNIWVLDSGNSRVQIFSTLGVFISTWGSFGNGPFLLNNPLGMAVNHIDQAIVADTGNFRFEVFNDAATPVTQEGWFGEGPYQFKEPAGAAVTRSRLLAIADGDRVDFYNGNTGDFEYLGRWKAGSHWTGLKNGARFHGITSDRMNRIYLTDVNNNWVVRLRPEKTFRPPYVEPTPTPEATSPYGGQDFPIR